MLTPEGSTAAGFPPGFKLPDRERFSDRVFGAMGMNPGWQFSPGTNTFLVGTGSKRLLIDTGEGQPAYIPNMEAALRENGIEIEQIIITHWHNDHLGGVPSLIERFGSHIPVRKYMPAQDEELATAGEGSVNPYSIWPKEKFVPMVDGEVIRTEGASLRVMFTPGHANDHCAFYMEEEQTLFTGDNVLGVGTSVFQDHKLYMDSLKLMMDTKAKVCYPAHGPVIKEGVGRLQQYITHREIRSAQIVKELMLANSVANGLTPEEVTRKIYTTHPENLVKMAIGNTILELRGLLNSGKAKSTDPDVPQMKLVGTGKSEFARRERHAKFWWAEGGAKL